MPTRQVELTGLTDAELDKAIQLSLGPSRIPAYAGLYAVALEAREWNRVHGIPAHRLIHVKLELPIKVSEGVE